MPGTFWNSNNSGLQYLYQLRFSGGELQHLAAAEHLADVDLLDISRNKLKTIDPIALEKLLRVASDIMLNDNQLTTLPKEVQRLKFRGKISLHNNPWNCNCEHRWLQTWLLSIKASLATPSAILCSSPTWLNDQSLLESDFCSPDPDIKHRRWFSIGVGSIACAILLLCCSFLLLYKARIWIFTRFHIRIFNEWDDCTEGEYDAFVSFAWDDYTRVREVVDLLEDKHGFRCCVHNRDFDPARRFLDMMANAIDNSRRTLCFLSPNFAQSEYCIWEMQYALDKDNERGKRRLAAILLDPITQFDETNRVVRQYISTYTYLPADNEDFEQKLLYIMPSSPLDQNRAPEEYNEESPLLSNSLN
jgi:hypothetical protein